MKFSAQDDIEAPIDFVFEQTTDFATFERSIMRRGAEIERVAGGGGAELGSKWVLKFIMRGREREVHAELVDVQVPDGYKIRCLSDNIGGDMHLELVALSPARTRLTLTGTAQAKTIPAKLLMKSLKFARAKTDAKFAALVANFAKDLEQKYRS